MKEIIGDDYPTYEDSVKMTLAEREIHKDNLERLLKENIELKNRSPLNIDYKLLETQRNHLLSILWDDDKGEGVHGLLDKEIGWGIIHLLDALIDENHKGNK